MVFHFVIPVLIHSIFFLFFSVGIIISSTFLEFLSGTGFGSTILSAIFFTINPSVALAALWNTFSEAVFRASSPVLVAVSNNCSPYLLDRFHTNDKNPYPLTFFSLLVL